MIQLRQLVLQRLGMGGCLGESQFGCRVSQCSRCLPQKSEPSGLSLVFDAPSLLKTYCLHASALHIRT